jgi:hypothetical protein
MSDPNQPFQPPPPPSTQEPAERQRPANMMTVGIVLFVLGLIIAVGGITKFIAGGMGTGGAVCALGVLLFALSFVRLPEVPADAPAPMSALARIAGIFFEPGRVFQNLRVHPRWLIGVLLIGILNAAYIAAFTQRLTPERIVNYTADKMAETPFIPPEAVERARTEGVEQAKSSVFRAGNAVRSMVAVVFFMAFLAALYLLGTLAFGGRMNFWQSMAVAVYAALPAVIIQKLISFILLYVKSPDDIHPLMGQETLVQDNLGVLFSPKDHPVLFVTAASLGILSFYRLWLTAKGLHEGGQKVSSSAGWGVAITLWVLGLLLVVAITALFPSFIS